MKRMKHALLLPFLLLCFQLSTIAQGSDFTDPVKEVYSYEVSGGLHAVLTFVHENGDESSGDFMLVTKYDGQTNPEQEISFGVYTKTNTSIEFTDAPESGCSNGGNYSYTLTDNILSFTRISDLCLSRFSVLTAQAFELVPPPEWDTEDHFVHIKETGESIVFVFAYNSDNPDVGMYRLATLPDGAAEPDAIVSEGEFQISESTLTLIDIAGNCSSAGMYSLVEGDMSITFTLQNDDCTERSALLDGNEFMYMDEPPPGEVEETYGYLLENGQIGFISFFHTEENELSGQFLIGSMEPEAQVPDAIISRGNYLIDGNSITFTDGMGSQCNVAGEYTFVEGDETIEFMVTNDACAARNELLTGGVLQNIDLLNMIPDTQETYGYMLPNGEIAAITFMYNSENPANGQFMIGTIIAGETQPTDIISLGNYTIAGTSITFDDEIGSHCTVQGVYEFTESENTVIYTLVSDDCAERSEILTGFPFVLLDYEQGDWDSEESYGYMMQDGLIAFVTFLYNSENENTGKYMIGTIYPEDEEPSTLVAVGSYVINENSVTFTSGLGSNCYTDGTYIMTLEGDNLTFEKVVDFCNLRVGVLTAATMKPLDFEDVDWDSEDTYGYMLPQGDIGFLSFLYNETAPETGNYVIGTADPNTFEPTGIISFGIFNKNDVSITFTDQIGGLCPAPGEYIYTDDENTITFTTIADDCMPRNEFLTAQPLPFLDEQTFDEYDVEEVFMYIQPDGQTGTYLGLTFNEDDPFSGTYMLGTGFPTEEEIDIPVSMGTYSIDGNSMVFLDIMNPECQSEGSYTFTDNNGTLEFTLVSDDCTNRRDLLTATPLVFFNEEAHEFDEEVIFGYPYSESIDAFLMLSFDEENDDTGDFIIGTIADDSDIPDKIITFGTFSITGNTVSFTNVFGGSCPSDAEYNFVKVGDNLTFTEISDDCTERLEILTGGTFSFYDEPEYDVIAYENSDGSVHYILLGEDDSYIMISESADSETVISHGMALIDDDNMEVSFLDYGQGSQCTNELVGTYSFMDNEDLNMVTFTKITDNCTARDEFLTGSPFYYIDDYWEDNLAPEVAYPIPDQVIEKDQPYMFVVPEATFSDPEGNPLIYAASRSNGASLPDWLTFNPETRTFEGTPPNQEIVQIAVSAFDEYFAEATDVFNLIVGPHTNIPVETYIQINIEVNTATITVSPDAFEGMGLGNIVTYLVTLSDGSDLPDWITFDPETLTFTVDLSKKKTTDSEVTDLNLMVTAVDEDEKNASVKFTLTAGEMTGIKQLEAADVKIYPNPSKGIFTLETTELHSTELHYTVTDVAGRTVVSKTNISAETQTIDLSAFPKGIYIMKISGKQMQSVVKLMVE